MTLNKILSLHVLLLSIFLGQQTQASQPARAALAPNDLRVIMKKWGEVGEALALDDWTSTEQKASVLIAMFDSGAVIQKKYRSYSHVDPQLLNFPDSMNRVRLSEAASLQAFVAHVNQMEKKWKPQLNLEQEANFAKVRLELDATVKDYLNRFETSEIEITQPVSQNVVNQLTEVLRANAAGTLEQYALSNEPGRFRYEPGVVPDSLIKYVGAKTYATCDFDSVTAEMKRTLPAFDADYIAQIEEVRCLGRKDDANGNPVLGPNCPRTITPEELKTATLGYETSSVFRDIQSHIAKTRDYGFQDFLRARVLYDVGSVDATTIVWSLRPFMNHWRPASAIRSGSGHKESLWTVEQDWDYRHPTNYCEPEYPSGIASASATDVALMEALLNEDARHSGRGKDVTLIDGEKPKIEWKGSYKQNGTKREVSEEVLNLDQLVFAASNARVLSGGHFRRSVEDSTKLGTRIGKQIWQNGFLALIGGPNDRGGSYLTLDGAYRHCAH